MSARVYSLTLYTILQGDVSQACIRGKTEITPPSLPPPQACTSCEMHDVIDADAAHALAMVPSQSLAPATARPKVATMREL